MKILVTGASGFLGSALALHLQAKGYQPVLLLRHASQLQRLKGRESGFIVSRCSSDEEVAAFIQQLKPDIVLHTAGVYGRKGESMLQITDANIRFGLVILQALMQSAQKVTFINTGTVLDADVSDYARSKQQFSDWGKSIATRSAGQIQFLNVRLQHMYGPGDATEKFTSFIVHRCHQHSPEIQLTSGEQQRDFIYIDDVISGYTTLIEKRDRLERVEDIDLGSGVAVKVREFVELAHQLTQSTSHLMFGTLPYRVNEPMHSLANLERMSSLGWQPQYDLVSGLKKYIELEFNQ